MDVIWAISFKITAEIEVRKHTLCLLLRGRVNLSVVLAILPTFGHYHLLREALRITYF